MTKLSILGCLKKDHISQVITNISIYQKYLQKTPYYCGVFSFCMSYKYSSNSRAVVQSTRYSFEKNSEEIKNEIILFISKIKKKKINDLELRKFLSFDNDFSIWDISLINEKNVYKSDCILNLTKFIAIKKILKKNFTKKIILQNFDKKFIQK